MYHHERKLVPEVLAHHPAKMLVDVSEVFDAIPIHDGMTLSFHHHLRNGDHVFNMVLQEIKRQHLKNMTLAPSAIFPNNDCLAPLIEAENVVGNITIISMVPSQKPSDDGYLRDHFDHGNPWWTSTKHLKQGNL
jgi:citrate lyase subunit alpha/citrate CoA-transferase